MSIFNVRVTYKSILYQLLCLRCLKTKDDVRLDRELWARYGTVRMALLSFNMCNTNSCLVFPMKRRFLPYFIELILTQTYSCVRKYVLIIRFMGPIWGRQDPGGTQRGAPWTLLYGCIYSADRVTNNNQYHIGVRYVFVQNDAVQPCADFQFAKFHCPSRYL